MADILIQPMPVQAGKKYIKVNKPGIEKSEGSSIVFKNVLPQSPEARVTFYEMDEKGQTGATPISDFCQGQTKTYFSVPGTGNGEATCTLTKTEGNFAYSISTEPAVYEPLDPIIIIEPSQIGAKSLYAPIIGFLAGAALMYVLCRTLFSKAK